MIEWGPVHSLRSLWSQIAFVCSNRFLLPACKMLSGEKHASAFSPPFAFLCQGSSSLKWVTDRGTALTLLELAGESNSGEALQETNMFSAMWERIVFYCLEGRYKKPVCVLLTLHEVSPLLFLLKGCRVLSEWPLVACALSACAWVSINYML